MAIQSSESIVTPQADGQQFVEHRYTFDSAAPILRADRGLRPGSFDVNADRVALEPRALDYESDYEVYSRAEAGFWHPDTNPSPIWDQSNPSIQGKIGKVIVADAVHIDERFNGVTPWDGQYAQMQIIFEDPLLDGKTLAQIANALGITQDEARDLRDHYQLISNAVNRNGYNTITESTLKIREIEFGFNI